MLVDYHSKHFLRISFHNVLVPKSTIEHSKIQQV